MNEDNAPQLSPEDFGRRMADAAVPILEEAMRRVTDELSRAIRDAMIQPAAQAPAPAPQQWTGGPPTSEQSQRIVQQSSSLSMTTLASDVSDIKAAVQQMASNASGGD